MATSKTPKTSPSTDPIAALRLGDSVRVAVPAGSVLRNNESGGLFDPQVATPQTVTTTLLRRLQDGDLVLVA